MHALFYHDKKRTFNAEINLYQLWTWSARKLSFPLYIWYILHMSVRYLAILCIL